MPIQLKGAEPQVRAFYAKMIRTKIHTRHTSAVQVNRRLLVKTCSLMRFFMRITTRTIIALSAALIFASAIGVQAAVTASPKTTPGSGQKTAAESTEVTTLRSALALLRGADHDYKGHRAIAMQKIAEACRLLNNRTARPARGETASRHGDPSRGHCPAAGGQKTEKPEPEPQGASDAQAQTGADACATGCQFDPRRHPAKGYGAFWMMPSMNWASP